MCHLSDLRPGHLLSCLFHRKLATIDPSPSRGVKTVLSLERGATACSTKRLAGDTAPISLRPASQWRDPNSLGLGPGIGPEISQEVRSLDRLP